MSYTTARIRLPTGLTPGLTAPPEAIYHSNYHIIVNSNRRFTNLHDAQTLGARLQDAVESALDAPNLTPNLNWLSGSGRVTHVEIQSGAEVGTNPRGRRIHVHAALHILHTGRMQLDYVSMRRTIKEQCALLAGVPNPFVKFILAPRDPMHTLRQYIEKTAHTLSLDGVTDDLDSLSL